MITPTPFLVPTPLESADIPFSIPTPFDHGYSIPNVHALQNNFSTIKFMALNVCGLFSKVKYGIFEDSIKDCDFVCISETKTKFIAPDEFPDFQVFISNKSTKLAILAKKNEHFYQMLQFTSSKHILWLAVGKSSTDLDFILGAAYIPCAASADSSENIFEEIFLDMVEIKSKYDAPIILMGDFNARTALIDDFLDLEDSTSGNELFENFTNFLDSLNLRKRFNSDHTKYDINGKGLINLCRNFNLCIVNGRCGSDRGVGNPTCYKAVNGTVIDYMLVSDCLIPHLTDFNIGLFDKTLSDFHCPLYLKLRCLQENKTSDVSENNPPVHVQKHKNLVTKWKNELKFDYQNSFSVNESESLSIEMDNFLNSSNLSQDNIDNLVLKVNTLFIGAAKSVGLCKTPKDNVRKYSRIFPNKPWFDRSCNSFRKNYLDLKYKKHGKNWKNTLSTNFKHYKKFLDSKQIAFKRETEKKLRSLKNSDSRAYWKIINGACNVSSQKECKVSMGTLFKHFENLSFKELPETSFDPRNVTHEGTVNEELNRDFTVDEVLFNIKKLKTNKSSGLDQIVNEHIKNCPRSVILLIVKLFNLILKSGLFPSEWCKGLIIPLFKNKGSPNNIDNYRGITLLSVLGKLFTLCFNTRLTNYTTSRGIIGEEQAAFKKHYSTIDHHFVLNLLIEFYKARYDKLFCAFIDYKKAFDLIDRSSLWMKLIENEINGNFVKVIFNMYDQAKSCVRKGNEISEFFLCNIGVRQGENLSPLLFSIFLNDFTRFISSNYNGLTHISSLCSVLLSDADVEVFFKLFALLYADDTIVLAESEQELQNALCGVYSYCDTWKLKVNVEKTKIVIFSRGKVKKHRNFLFGSNPVEVVDEYNYLGMIFSYNGTFVRAIEYRLQQAQKAMYSLLTKARRLCLPIDIICDLFDKTVVPVLLYASEVWGSGNLASIEVFYRKFFKIVLLLNKITPSVIVLGEVGKLPLKYTIYKRMLSFWIKVTEDCPLKFSNVIYRLMFNLHTSGGVYNFPWFNKIKYILDICNFSNLWQNQADYQPPNTKIYLKNTIFETLDNVAQEIWLNEVNTNTACFIYRIFKHTLNFEKYLVSLPFTLRKSFSKFRCRNNKLPTNKFRFSKTVTDRNCSLCLAGDLGDEYHYLFICDSFLTERKKYLSHYFYHHPNTMKMCQLFNTTNTRTLLDLCKFIGSILLKFK